MPEKTHRRPVNGGVGFYVSLKLFRRSVPERRMQAADIVVTIDEFYNVGPQAFEIPITVSVDLFPLERLHETLTACVVIGIRRPAHARNHLVLPQSPHIVAGRIL